MQLPAFLRSRVLVGAVVALWVAILVMGFVAQTTELFGTHSSLAALLLLGLALVGFVIVGSVGVLVVLPHLDRESTRPVEERADPPV